MQLYSLIADQKSRPHFFNTGMKDKQMSPTEPKVSVREFLAAIELPDSVRVEKIYKKLESHFIETDINTTNLETLTIKQAKGSIVSIASTKFSNLKFQLKDLLLETARSSVKIKSSFNDGLALTLIVLEFLQKVGGLMEHELSQNEAQVLLEIYKLENEKETITVDSLFFGLKEIMDEPQILKSLDLLEKLSCIQYGTDRIELVEVILFTQE